LFINLKFTSPISCSEKNIIIKPAEILNISELAKKIFPNDDADSPRIIKTKENPKVKKIVLKTTTLLLSWDNLSNVVPEIYEIYPGIKGSTHGDKKLTNPAKKAIGKYTSI
jgi:hypothetical protein